MASLLSGLSIDQKLKMMESAPIITVDTEGYRPNILGASIAFTGLSEGFYLPFRHSQGNLTDEQKKRLYEILGSREALVFHNAIHDLRSLADDGFVYRGRFYDTMLMDHWIFEESLSYDLTSVSRRWGGKPKAMPEQMKMIIESDGWEAVPVAWMDEYSSNDAYITNEAFEQMLPEFQAQGFDGTLWDNEQIFIRDVMGPMMDIGIKVDVGFSVKEYMRGLGIMEECKRELGFKPSSPKALEQFLIKDLGLPVVKHTKSCEKCYPKDRRQRSQSVAFHNGKPAFDKEAMTQYDEMLEKKDDPRAQTILTYKGWLKTTSSNYKPYMELVDSNNVLHPGYKLHGTRTGRLSCADPNLQQIPKSSDKDWNGGLKQAFIAREGYGLWTIDYSQLQYRMAVAYAVAYARGNGYRCPEEELLAIFNDPSRDIFTEQSKSMGWLRADVKTLVYLILFGGGANRAAAAFSVSVSQGKELVEEFYTNYPNMKKVSEQAQRAAQQNGYVTYWTGRRRHFPRGSAYYRAFNASIQGGEAEIVKRALIAVATDARVPRDECRPILQIHDEAALEIKLGMEQHYIPLVQGIMENAAGAFCDYLGVSVDFRTSSGKWGEK